MTKVCKVCEKPNPNPLIKTCSYKCSDIFAGRVLNRITKKRAIKQQKEWNQRKKRLKGLTYWIKETKKVAQEYAAKRDGDKPCVTCGKYLIHLDRTFLKRFDGGHFRSVGSQPSLQLNQNNIFGQCRDCNGFKGGKPKEYEAELIKRLGQQKVDWLKGDHDAQNWSFEYLERYRRIFRKRMKRYAQSD